MRALKTSDITRRWPELATRLDRALTDNLDGLNAHGILTSATSGHAVILEHERTVLAMQILDGSQGRVAHVLAYEGPGGLMFNGLYTDVLSRIASEYGAERLTLTGRAGWRRALKPFGWSEASTTLSKEVA